MNTMPTSHSHKISEAINLKASTELSSRISKFLNQKGSIGGAGGNIFPVQSEPKQKLTHKQKQDSICKGLMNMEEQQLYHKEYKGEENKYMNVENDGGYNSKKKIGSSKKQEKIQEKEESEVQDDSDGELRRQILRENIDGINCQAQKAATTTTSTTLQTLPTLTNGGGDMKGQEEDTEGESVLIGDEEFPTTVVSTKRKQSNKNIQNQKISKEQRATQQIVNYENSQQNNTLNKQSNQMRTEKRSFISNLEPVATSKNQQLQSSSQGILSTNQQDIMMSNSSGSRQQILKKQNTSSSFVNTIPDSELVSQRELQQNNAISSKLSETTNKSPFNYTIKGASSQQSATSSLHQTTKYNSAYEKSPQTTSYSNLKEVGNHQNNKDKNKKTSAKVGDRTSRQQQQQQSSTASGSSSQLYSGAATGRNKSKSKSPISHSQTQGQNSSSSNMVSSSTTSQNIQAKEEKIVNTKSTNAINSSQQTQINNSGSNKQQQVSSTTIATNQDKSINKQQQQTINNNMTNNFASAQSNKIPSKTGPSYLCGDIQEFQLPSPIQSSSGGSSTKYHFENTHQINNTKKQELQQQQQQIVNNRYQQKNEKNSQNAFSHKSSISQKEEEDVEKLQQNQVDNKEQAYHSKKSSNQSYQIKDDKEKLEMNDNFQNKRSKIESKAIKGKQDKILHQQTELPFQQVNEQDEEKSQFIGGVTGETSPQQDEQSQSSPKQYQQQVISSLESANRFTLQGLNNNSQAQFVVDSSNYEQRISDEQYQSSKHKQQRELCKNGSEADIYQDNYSDKHLEDSQFSMNPQKLAIIPTFHAYHSSKGSISSQHLNNTNLHNNHQHTNSKSQTFNSETNNNINHNINSNIQILETENMFSPVIQFTEYDLAQYNSPSFATGNHHLMSNYQSLTKQMQMELAANQSNRNTLSSYGRDSDLVYSLPLQYEQKIIVHSKKTFKTVFLKLPGEVLTMVGDFLNQKLPIFIFTNRISFKIFLQHSIEFYEQQRQLAYQQGYHIQRELDRIENASNFDLSSQSREEYDSLQQLDWDDLIRVCQCQSKDQELQSIILKQKDIIILRLYLTFMGLDLAEEIDDSKFLSQTSEFMKDCGAQVSELMDPERSFIISQENNKRIKELLVNLQKEKLIEEDMKSEQSSNLTSNTNISGISNSASESSRAQKVIETFTNLLFEALQFVNIIPNVLVSDMNNELEDVKRMAEGYNAVKNNLIDFKNLIA